MDKILSFEEEKMRLKIKKAILIGKFTIFAEGESIEEARIYIKAQNQYVYNILYDLINSLLSQLFERNNKFQELAEKEEKVDMKEILNKEFSFYIYEYRGESFVQYFPKVGDGLITVLLSYAKMAL